MSEIEPITIAEACEQLERNPQIRWLSVDLCNTQQARGYLNTVENSFAPETYFSDGLFDVETWRRLGAAVGNNTSLHKLSAGIDRELLPPAAARCLDAFWAELKHNKSIAHADFRFRGESIDHLIGFIQNNEALTCLALSCNSLSLEQSTGLSTAIGRAQLTEVTIYCKFEHDGSFEQFLEGCVGVDRLRVLCLYNSQCTAVAALLRGTTHLVRDLKLTFRRYVNRQQAVREITESLVENTTLKALEFDAVRSHERDGFDFEKLLCDASSIQSISNSNHTLERISLLSRDFTPDEAHRYELSPFTEQCLVFNQNDDKDKVIRDKISHFYFVGEFDVAPFSSMAVSVLPEVVSQIQGAKKLSAIYRLLQLIPELCSGSERKCSHQSDNKRHKIVK
jgi:hypothetical protein